MWPPITKKAGLQDRPFLVFSYQQDLKVHKITLVFYCCGSLVIYILPVFSTVPWKKLLFKNFMLWSRSCRISNWGDNGPLGYGLSCCSGHCSDTFSFIHFHLNVLCIDFKLNKVELDFKKQNAFFKGTKHFLFDRNAFLKNLIQL